MSGKSTPKNAFFRPVPTGRATGFFVRPSGFDLRAVGVAGWSRPVASAFPSAPIARKPSACKRVNRCRMVAQCRSRRASDRQPARNRAPLLAFAPVRLSGTHENYRFPPVSTCAAPSVRACPVLSSCRFRADLDGQAVRAVLSEPVQPVFATSLIRASLRCNCTKIPPYTLRSIRGNILLLQ